MKGNRATDGPATSRRALLAGAGAIGASVALAACGDDSARSGDPATDNAVDTGVPEVPGALTSTSAIPVGGGKIFAEKGVVVTQPVAGEFKGFSAICTHKHCPVSNISGGTINCTCHGSRFSIEDGSVRTGPATQALPAKEINVEGDVITLA